MSLKIIFSSIYLEEVHLVRSLLDQENIESTIVDENIDSLMSPLRAALGGTKLAVPEHHLPTALACVRRYTKKIHTFTRREIKLPFDTTQCPECGNEHIIVSKVPLQTPSPLVSLLSNFPMYLKNHYYQCNQCGVYWKITPNREVRTETLRQTPKVVLITGTSTGFGLLIAARLASKKYTVIATMRNVQKKEALLNEVAKRGGRVEVYPLDVTNKVSIEAAIKYVSEKYGYIDVLINNAGYGMAGFFEDLTDKEIRQQMETNFFGVQNVTRQAIPLMRRRIGSKIINVSSAAGFSASPCFGAYNASKWALEGFTESLRHELKLFGIDVLLIEPGMYNTKIFHENARCAANFDNPKSPYRHVSRFLKKRVENALKDCFKDPEEIAALVEKLINAKRPPFRNIPDIEAKTHYFTRKFLPFWLYSLIVDSILFKNFKHQMNAYELNKLLAYKRNRKVVKIP